MNSFFCSPANPCSTSPALLFILCLAISAVGVLLFDAGLRAALELPENSHLWIGLVAVGMLLLAFACAMLISLSGIFTSNKGIFACGLGSSSTETAAASDGATILGRNALRRSSRPKPRHGGMPK